MIPLRQKGLSLIEVMIALAVFSFGLLALAALMASGLKYNTSALHRSYATNQAYDMADRMRANRLGLDSGCYDGGSDSDTDSVCFSESDANPDCIESGCTPEQMAQYDRWQWNTDNARLLPEGEGTVHLKPSDSSIYTITIYWNDDRDPETEADNFIFEFQP
jgi:type IV pilus assembly protein PilV